MNKKISALLLFCATSSAHAAIVANSLPFSGSPDWTNFTFSGTSMVVDGGGTSSTLTTSNFAGVWFGWGSSPTYNNQPSGWAPGSSTAGNYLSLNASFSVGAADWSAYLYDNSSLAFFDFAATGCNPNVGACYGLPGAQGVSVAHAGTTSADYATTFIALDLTLEHSYEFLLKAGLVSYRIDGQTVYSGAAYDSNLGNPLLVIGDGSGSSGTGVGSMTVYGVGFDNAPLENVLVSSVPVPAAVWLFGSGLIGLAGVARRKA